MGLGWLSSYGFWFCPLTVGTHDPIPGLITLSGHDSYPLPDEGWATISQLMKSETLLFPIPDTIDWYHLQTNKQKAKNESPSYPKPVSATS